MSSPKVLTSVRMPLEIARAGNKRDTARYLALARELYNQIQDLEASTLEMGGDVPHVPVMAYPEAEAKAWAIYANGVDAGYPAVTFAHAYWQSLKHPRHDQSLKCYSEAAAAEARQRESQQARLEELTQSILSDFKTHHDYTIQQINAAEIGSSHTWEQKISETINAITYASRSDEIDSVQQSLRGITEKNPQEMYIALKTLLVAVEHKGKLRMQAEVLQAYHDKRREMIAERVDLQIKKCSGQVEELESEVAALIADDLRAIRVEAETSGYSDEIEDRVRVIDERINVEVSRQGLLESTISALRRLGYETIEVMSVLGPPEIASVYLQDPKDRDRVALVQVAEELGMMSAEMVRRVESDSNSNTQKMLDKESQKRLCKAMAIAQQELEKSWAIQTISDTAPGAQMQVKTDIKRIDTKRVRIMAKQQSRRV